MPRWQRGFIVLTAAWLALMLAACPLMFHAIRTQALTPPAVLLDLGPVWLGDVCRGIQSQSMPIRCPPAYTITLMLDRKRSFVLVRIPIAGPRSRHF